MTAPSSSSTKLDTIQYHEYFKVVWFSLDNDAPNELGDFIDYFEKCHSFEACNNYITRSEDESRILLILVDLFEHLPYFGNLSRIQSIYLLGRNIPNVKEKELRCPKLVRIFTEKSLLTDKLKQDIRLNYRNDFSMHISRLNEAIKEQSLMALDKSAHTLLWYQLVIYDLAHSPNLQMDELKKEMIKQCQLEYSDNPTRLDQINSFDRTCTADNVLNWYTQDSFVFRLVNKAFRTLDIDVISKFRYFIILLYEKLKSLSIQQQKTQRPTVFRGQRLDKNELEVLQSSIGQLVSINTVMSTSRREDIARGFIAGAEVGVLFEINTASTSYNMLHPFADISRYSSMPHEEEILFFAGAIFRLDSIRKENDSTWIIKLTLDNEKAEQMEQLMDAVESHSSYITVWEQLFIKVDDFILFGKYYKILTNRSFAWKDIVTSISGIDISRLINISGNHERVIKYYEDLIFADQSSDHYKQIVLHILIGYNYSRLCKYEDAIFYYDIVLSSVNENSRLAGEIYIHLGDIDRATKDFDAALSHYEKALIVLTGHHVDDRDIAKIYRKVSDIHRNQHNDAAAIVYQEQADEIDQQYAQRSELNIDVSLEYFQNHLHNLSDDSQVQSARSLYAMGLCWMKKSDYHQALEKFLAAEVLLKTHLPLTNDSASTFISLYDSLALNYVLMKDRFNALVMLKKSIDIRASYS